MLRRYDLNLLPIFDALIREESLTKAAETLGMSQPAVSNALKRLRYSLKDDLFVRTKAGLRPTQRALELRELFAPALDLISRGLDDREFVPENYDRVIEIAMDAVVEFVSMPNLVQEFRALSPKLKLQVHTNHIHDIPSRLKDGRLHYVVEYTDLAADQFDSMILATDTLSVICAAQHAELESTITLNQYQALPHVSIVARHLPGASKPNARNTPVQLISARHAPSRNIQIRVSNFFAIPEIVAKTDLIAIVPSRLAKPYCDQGLLKKFELPFDYPNVVYRLFWHKSRSNDPAHSWILSVFSKLVAREILE